MRSTTAPLIRAGVMIANIAWNITKTYAGMVPLSCPLSPASPTFWRLPTRAFPPGAKARE